MKLKTLLTVCAEVAVLAIWVAVGFAAHRSLGEHEAQRSATEAPAKSGAVATIKMDDKHVKE